MKTSFLSLDMKQRQNFSGNECYMNSSSDRYWHTAILNSYMVAWHAWDIVGSLVVIEDVIANSPMSAEIEKLFW